MPLATIASGTRLYYERIGEGPPLLLIMGTGLDHSVWDAQVEAYRHEFECIVFDNAGTGKSGRTDDRLTVKSMAVDTIELLEALGIERVHVSGLSLGSCIAQELTLARPEMVESLQLHGTWARTDGYAARKFRAQIRLIEMLDMRDFYEINVLWFITPEFFDAHPERVEAQIDAIVANAPSRESLIEQYQADIEHYTLDRLPQIAGSHSRDGGKLGRCRSTDVWPRSCGSDPRRGVCGRRSGRTSPQCRKPCRFQPGNARIPPSRQG